MSSISNSTNTNINNPKAYSLECLDCEFKKMFFGRPHENDIEGDDVAGREAFEATKDHLKRFKHKEILVNISSRDFVKYNKSTKDKDTNNNNSTIAQAPTTTTAAATIEKEEEDLDKKVTGCYALQCKECEFTEIIWGLPSGNKDASIIFDAFESHSKRLKHNNLIFTTTTLWIARYDDSKDDLITESAPKREYRYHKYYDHLGSEVNKK